MYRENEGKKTERCKVQRNKDIYIIIVSENTRQKLKRWHRYLLMIMTQQQQRQQQEEEEEQRQQLKHLSK